MSNHEIEDVLSSIRRLVSEDLRPAARAADADAVSSAPPPLARPAPAASTEKLILTPAFRVVDAPAVQSPAPTPLAEAANTVASEDDLTAPSSPAEASQVISRLSAAMAQTEEEWESPVGDHLGWQAAAVDEPAPKAHPSEGAGRLHFSAMPDDQQDADAFAHADAPEAADVWAAAVEDDSFAEVEMIEDPASVSRRVVSPPDDAGWADAAEAEVRAELDRESDQAGPSVFDTQDVTFDEAVLRDLVRDIIREELAGTLGERITRNVRKLVRAEIARALAVREFE